MKKETKKIKYEALIIAGQSPSSDSYNTEGDGFPFLQGCADFGEVYPVERYYSNAPKKLSEIGDVLISVRAPVGDLNVSDKVYSIGRGLAIVRGISSSTKFLYYVLQAEKKRLNSMSTGSTFKAISSEDLKNFEIFVPKIHHQKTIEKFLNRKTMEIDDLIAEKEKLIKLLEEKRQAVITEAVTKGLDPNVKMKESGVEWIGTIPEHWEVFKFKRGIKFLTDFEANGSFKDTKDNVVLDQGVPYAWYLRSTDLENRRFGIVEGNRYCNRGTYNFLNKTKLFGGELLITKRGEIGKVFLTPKLDCFATLAPNLYLIRLNDILDSNFAYYWFISRLGKSELVNANKSTTIGALYKDDIKESLFLFPSIDEQHKIADYLSIVTQDIESCASDIKYQIDKLKEYRQSLIYEAVTGKIDVREMESELKEEEVSSS